ncbi:MAG: sulfite exporter TauE/SafE family protein [Spirochaetes bacterium]|nr:sulfite exporter TauE/SafE family protein [Spirochaetota bacterium]
MGSTSPLIAFAAGLFSFLSPCIIPLIPSYLTFIGGTTFQELSSGQYGRARVIARTLLFVLGFTLVFTALGIAMSGVGTFFGRTTRIVSYAAGGVVVLFGLNIVFDFWKLLDTERRFHLARRPSGWVGSILVGMAFAAGWTPCVGPILASILFVAGTSADVVRGAFLLLAYSLGLGLPFVAAGLFFGFFMRQVQRLKPWLGAIRIASGLFLVALGILIILGRLQGVSALAFRGAAALQEWNTDNPSGPRLLFGSLLVVPSLALLWSTVRRTVASRRLPPVRTVLFMTLAVLSILTFLGVIDTAAAVSGWLKFQGI